MGAGVGLVSLFLSKVVECTCIISDSFDHVLGNIQETIQRNQVRNGSMIRLSWGSPIPELPVIDWIIGSDLFYNPSDFEPLIITINDLLNRNPNAICLMAYQERSSKRSITILLEKYDLKAELLVHGNNVNTVESLDDEDQITSHFWVRNEGEEEWKRGFEEMESSMKSVFLFSIQRAK